MDYDVAPREGRRAARTAAAPAQDQSNPPARRRIEVLETYFGADGRPVKRKSIGAARVARHYDERGNKVEEAYFNADGKPTLRKGLGVAKIAWRYDERGRQIDASFFDAAGEPVQKGAAARDRALADA
ncbi:hypothetical protein MSC49_14860 [Methylosinus sp. C49]|jgi:hypothetical protein|uniref:hypothetical protein n=1 Tax=Methylosinus sp. C49 TaxID=2699395 RepID=UPI001366E58C|nr:hypothetical protein [Methylosinus sp. C49]BBU61551.1 hypothetical protein MSC49_14860 [Methylosinus sp. C49]